MFKLAASVPDNERRSSFFEGFIAVLPAQAGLVPFAVIIGITAVELGITPAEILGMSILVFAGASQLAAIFLMADGASIVVILATVLALNVRFVIYSASIAPFILSLSRLHKAVYAYLLTDPGYAISIPRLQSDSAPHSHWYYFGVTFGIWVGWILGTLIGAGISGDIPDGFPIELVLPFIFLALLFSVIEDRTTAISAATAGVVAMLTASLGYNLELVLGVAAGVSAGVYVDR